MPKDVKQLTQGHRAKKWQAEVQFESIFTDSKSRIPSIPSNEGTEKSVSMPPPPPPQMVILYRTNL